MNIKQTLSDISKKRSKLFKYFECDYTWLPIEECFDEHWAHDGNSVFWGRDKEDLEAEPEYSEEIHGSCIYEKDDYTMFVIITCTGDGKVAIIFDNKMRMNDWKEW